MLNAYSEDHLPENCLGNLLKMLQIPRLNARSIEPDSRRMKFITCFPTYMATEAS